MDEEKVVDVILYSSSGAGFTIGSIRVDDELDHVMREGVKYELCPMYGAPPRFGAPVRLRRFVLAPIPAEEKHKNVPVDISAKNLVADYQIASISEDDRGIQITYAKKTKTVEQLERELDLARHEIDELKKLNARQHDLVYKECLAEAKRDIIQAIGEL